MAIPNIVRLIKRGETHMRRIVRGMKFWPVDARAIPASRVIEMYHQGFAGAFEDPEAGEELDDTIAACAKANGTFASADDMLHTMKFADSGVGQLTILFPSVVKNYGYEALTRPAQETGDCVSMMARDVALYECCVSADSGQADEKTGKVESVPQVSELAKRNGVFANEGVYKNRGHNGQGMSCDQAVNYVMTKGGIILRQNYSDKGGVDLERYNVNFEVGGSRGSPEWLNAVGREHPIRNVLKLRSHEEVRDTLAATKAPIGTCSSLGFSRTRDENGYSRRQGGWGHSWHVIGYDDRPETVKIYGFPLALFGHRWGPWNSGPRAIRDSASIVPSNLKPLFQSRGMLDANGNVLIPEGYAWIDARLLNQCWLAGFTSLTGWAGRTLSTVKVKIG